MLMSGPHFCGMPSKYDWIHFPSQDSYPNLEPLIANSSLQRFPDSEEDYYEFNDAIAKWLDQSYIESLIVNKRF